MIALTEEQYAAIGRVAVESGTLEREVGEYIVRLGHPKPVGLSRRLRLLRKLLSLHPRTKLAWQEFDFTLTAVGKLLEKRNTVVHGVWSKASNVPVAMGDMKTTGRTVTLHAREIASVAFQIRLARKFLLTLCHDHCPVAAGLKKRSSITAAKQKAKLLQALP